MVLVRIRFTLVRSRIQSTSDRPSLVTKTTFCLYFEFFLLERKKEACIIEIRHYIESSRCFVHGAMKWIDGARVRSGASALLRKGKNDIHVYVGILLPLLMILATFLNLPCDLTEIFVSENGGHRYFLGSLAAAKSIEGHNNTDGANAISIILSQQDMEKIRGQPSEGWIAYFRRLKVSHHAWSMDDVKTDHGSNPDYCTKMAESWCEAWCDMCKQLVLHESECVAADRPLTVLFHCFGGIHRSSAALCAWLMLRHDLSPEASLLSLLRVRPSLSQWMRRDHVFWLLHEWWRQCDDLRKGMQVLYNNSRPLNESTNLVAANGGSTWVDVMSYLRCIA